MFKIHSRVQRAMLVSMAAALITITLKFWAWGLTDSVGLFSDAVESLVNLAAAMLGFVLLGLAAQPADAEHPYGHEKAEYFASGVEGMLILVAAVSIAMAAIDRLITPAAVAKMDFGLLLSFIATLVNAAAAFWLMKVAREEKSVAVEADAHHLLTDVWTSVGILAALLLLLVFPTATWLDPVVAILVAVNIVRTGLMLMKRSVDGLMDMQLPPDDYKAVENVLMNALMPQVHIDALRTRHAGNRWFIEFNLWVPSEWTVQYAHDCCDQLEAAVLAHHAASDIVIHVEPIEEKQQVMAQ